MTDDKITAAGFWRFMLERAAADVGMTLEQAKQELAAGRVLFSFRFIVLSDTETVSHDDLQDETLQRPLRLQDRE